jgi:hypothetical protein
MFLVNRFIKLVAASVLIILAAAGYGFSQEEEKKKKTEAAMMNGKPVMWEAVNIGERDLYWGPGGQQMFPVLERAKYIGRQVGGNNPKHRLKDGAGREWVAKVADESQPEAAAVRLLWAIGYRTEINYLVPKLEIARVGAFKNARFEARPENIKRLDHWSWGNNPFVGTNEFEGLKIMMAMFNNWDLKDENNVVLQDGDRLYYVISDLGASFGRLADTSTSRAGRSVNKPEHYAQSNFIKQVRNGVIEFDYRGSADYLVKGIKVEHGRWLADLLLQLSDKQIEDAFRAANYEPEDVKLLAQAFKARIRELDEATKPAATVTAATETN